MSYQVVITLVILAVSLGMSLFALLSRHKTAKQNEEFHEEAMADWRAGSLVREQERSDQEAKLELENNLRGSRRETGE